jgi:hypothetical protein
MQYKVSSDEDAIAMLSRREVEVGDKIIVTGNTSYGRGLRTDLYGYNYYFEQNEYGCTVTIFGKTNSYNGG